MRDVNWFLMWFIITVGTAAVLSDKILSKDFYEMIFIAPFFMISATFHIVCFLPIYSHLNSKLKCLINCTIFVISIYFFTAFIKENDNLEAFCVFQFFVVYYFGIYYEAYNTYKEKIDANSILWLIFVIIIIIKYFLNY